MSTLNISGIEKLNAKLNEIISQYPAEKDRFLRQEAEALRGRAANNTPVDTGHLRAGWQRTEVQGNDITVYNQVEYSKHVEYGHRKRGGNGVVKGKKMLHRAMDEMKTNFKSDAQNILGDLFR